MLFRHRAEGADQLDRQGFDLVDLVPEIEPDIERNLIVSRAGGMETLSGVADPGGQLRFDEHMNVLCLRVKGKCARFDVLLNRGQSFPDYVHVCL